MREYTKTIMANTKQRVVPDDVLFVVMASRTMQTRVEVLERTSLQYMKNVVYVVTEYLDEDIVSRDRQWKVVFSI